MSAERHTGRPDQLIAAEYVLGVLPHDERRAFAARLETDAGLQQQVRVWNEYFVSMTETIEDVEPSPAVLMNIQNRLFAGETSRSGWWSNLPFWRGLAVASLSLLILAGIFLSSTLLNQNINEPSYIADLSGESGSVRMVALFDPKSGQLRINRTEGLPNPGRSFELWFIAGNDAPVSLGVLPEQKQAVINLPQEMRSRVDGAVLAITDEPEGGSPTGTATGEILAAGNIIAI